MEWMSVFKPGVPQGNRCQDEHTPSKGGSTQQGGPGNLA